MTSQTKKNNEFIIVKTSECLYYLFWIIMLFAKGTGMYEGMRQYNVCLVLAMFCLIGKLVFTDYTILECLCMCGLVVLSGWIYLHGGDQSALILTGVVIGLKGINLTRVFQIGAVVFGGCFIYMIVNTLFFQGNLGPMLVHEKLGLGPVLRWSLGYTHPNVLQITYVILSCFILYTIRISGKRKKAIFLLLLMAGNCYIFLYSVSFTGFLFMTLLLLLYFYFTERNCFSKLERIVIESIFPFCAVFSLMGPMVIPKNGDLFEIINKVLNNRFLATQYYLSELGTSWFGIRVPKLGNFSIDCSYTEAFLTYGIVFFTIISVGYIFTIHYLIKSGQKIKLAIMVSLLIAGISEPFLFNTSFKNITVLFIGEWLFQYLKTFPGKKRFRLFSEFDREYTINIGATRTIVRQYKLIILSYWRQLACVAMISIIVCALLASVMAESPQYIYVGTGATDVADQDVFYLARDKLPSEFDGKIYEYAGDDSGLYRFQGNLIILEYVRQVISISLWGTMGIVCFTVVLMEIIVNRKIRRR